MICSTWMRNYPEFKEALCEQGKPLPIFVECKFDDFLRCGGFKHSFLQLVRANCRHKKHAIGH
jgi:hypothetical protein